MILDYFEMLKAKNPDVKWDDLVLYKLDLAGAYTLVSFSPEDVRKMAVELSDEVVMFFLGGHFRWTNTPGAFQTVTRSIVWELNNGILDGVASMYVDDILKVCLRKDLDSELARVTKLLTGLMGEKAVAEHNTEFGRRLTVKRYVIDLDKQLVVIAKRYALRALHGYMTTDLTVKHSVKFLQKLASWGLHYGKICRHMRPFVRYLYRSYANMKQYASVELDASGRLVVRLFRTLFMLGLCSVEGEILMSRSMWSFARNHYTWVVEFDGSLSRIGILFLLVNFLGEEILMASALVDVIALKFGSNSSNHNTSEFLGRLFAGRGLKMLGWEKEPVLYRGDSMSALSWIKKKRVKSDNASAAGDAFVLQAVTYGLIGLSQEHLAGELNVKADSRSLRVGWGAGA
jgi:hypothetical protein